MRMREHERRMLWIRVGLFIVGILAGTELERFWSAHQRARDDQRIEVMLQTFCSARPTEPICH